MAKSRSPLFSNRRVWISRIAGLSFAVLSAALLGPALSAGCSWDPRNPFERNAPEVEDAIRKIEAGQYESAEEVLAKYLGTGICGGDAGLAIPDTVREKYNGSFDLGLVLFHIAEKYGRRFGEEETGDDAQPGSPGQPGTPADDPQAQKRSQNIDCALLVVKAIANDPKVPVELRARAQYLAGNLEFLRKRYEEAVKEYDLSLTLIPGIPDDAGGDGIGRDAAWNRAIALRRILDQKDAGNDSDAPDSDDADSDAPDSDDADADSPDGDDGDSGDSGDDGGKGDSGDQDSDGGGKDGGADSGDQKDGGSDGGDQKDSGADKKDEDQPQPQPTTSAQPVSPDSLQDDRILDHLEEAPSYQEEEAKKRAAGRRRLKMEDK